MINDRGRGIGTEPRISADRLGSKGAKLLAYALVHYSNVHTVTLSGVERVWGVNVSVGVSEREFFSLQSG